MFTEIKKPISRFSSCFSKFSSVFFIFNVTQPKIDCIFLLFTFEVTLAPVIVGTSNFNLQFLIINHFDCHKNLFYFLSRKFHHPLLNVPIILIFYSSYNVFLSYTFPFAKPSPHRKSNK